MKRFWLRILVCLVPTLISIGVVAWAYNEYQNGRGGFVLGVDLVGGTILVYEVDESKMTAESRGSFKVEDLAAALKRRIDPADLYNVTIRPIGGTPERVEIILPTGGKHQADIESEKWAAILAEAKRHFELKEEPETQLGNRPQLTDDVAQAKRVEVEAFIKEQMNPKTGKPPAWADVVKATEAKYGAEDKESFLNVPKDNVAALADAAMRVQRVRISQWVDVKTGHAEGGGKGKKMLTGEEVENIKNLIARQGRLEFRILANGVDDAAGMEAARRWFDPLSPENRKKEPAVAVARQEELTRALQRAEPPPPPRAEEPSP
jgi:preprotein translocase subunit SecD